MSLLVSEQNFHDFLMQNYAQKYGSVNAQTFFFVKTILYASYKWGHIAHFLKILEDIVGVF